MTLTTDDAPTPRMGFEIFCATVPGLEAVLLDEVRGKGFRRPRVVPGGVVFEGGWPDAWRANLWLRGAGRVLVRVARFEADHLALLDRRARRVDWGAVLRREVPFRVEADCTKSRIYHSGAAAERVAGAIRATTGAAEDPESGLLVRARIERDVCTISVDTSGEALHRRGAKQAVAAAPLRETMAALLLARCGYRGEEPLVDPMCGAGTFVIEAAEIAARLNPGRLRRFAFEHLASFDAEAWARMRAASGARTPPVLCAGSDRDAGAIAMAGANAGRAGVAAHVAFRVAAVSDAAPPEGAAPGLVMVNPPYGARLGDAGRLLPLYQTLGRVLRARFGGWRVGLVTSEPALARGTGLPFLPGEAPIPHGGLRVGLYRTGVLP